MELDLKDFDVKAFEARAGQATRMLKALGNEKRLMILCTLIGEGEALSQHLARMREEGLVSFRRDAQTLYYRIADPNVARLIATLKNIYC
jgi:ArsR family transcriptional regulator, virulence genes transcriptional regulator